MNILLHRKFIESTDCLRIIKMSLSNEQSQFLTSSEISFLKCLVTNVNCKESKNSYLQSCSVRLSFSVQYKVVHHDLSSWDCNHIKVLHLTLKPIHSFESRQHLSLLPRHPRRPFCWVLRFQLNHQLENLIVGFLNQSVQMGNTTEETYLHNKAIFT